MMLLLILLTYLPPTQDVRRDHVSVIEQNVVLHETCEDDPLTHRITFTQILFRRWEPSTGQHEIHAWRMLKGYPVGEPIEGSPQRQRTNMAATFNHGTGLYEMRWYDGDVLRVVTADSYRESFTVGDIEVFERERFPRENRRELSK